MPICLCFDEQYFVHFQVDSYPDLNTFFCIYAHKNTKIHANPHNWKGPIIYPPIPAIAVEAAGQKSYPVAQAFAQTWGLMA